MNELLCLLNLGYLSDENKSQIRKLLHEVTNWKEFFELIDLNSVSLLSWKRLSGFQIEVQKLAAPLSNPSAFQSGMEILSEKAKKIEDAGQRRNQAIELILNRFNEEGLQVIVLKGNLFAHTIYDTPIYKKMNDVDILIRFPDAAKASKILKDLKYTCIKELLGGKEISESYHHAPPFVSSDLACVVGMHWGLHTHYSKWKSDIDGIWDRKILISVAGSPAFRMSWEDNLLHLCIHLPFYKIGLRELADVYNLVLFCQPEIDTEIFVHRVKAWKAEDPVFRVLSLVQALWPNEKLNSIYSSLFYSGQRSLVRTISGYSISSHCLKDTLKRIRPPDPRYILLRSRSTYISKIEKAFLIFHMSENYSEKIRAWAATWYLTFCPVEAEIRKMSVCNSPRNSLSFRLARIKTPFLILSAMARDYGSGFLLGVTLLNISIVLRDTLKLRFLKNRPKMATHPASSLLGVLE